MNLQTISATCWRWLSKQAGSKDPAIHQEATSLPSEDSWQQGKNSGTILVEDAPSIQRYTQTCSWTAMVVAQDYMGKGKDLLLGTFRWGWTGKGTTPIHTGINIKGNTPNSTELNTINHFYGTYQFFK